VIPTAEVHVNEVVLLTSKGREMPDEIEQAA